jgi:hypothetical protein
VNVRILYKNILGQVLFKNVSIFNRKKRIKLHPGFFFYLSFHQIVIRLKRVMQNKKALDMSFFLSLHIVYDVYTYTSNVFDPRSIKILYLLFEFDKIETKS